MHFLGTSLVEILQHVDVTPKVPQGTLTETFFPDFFFFFNSHDKLHEQGGIACSLNNNQAVVK